MARGILKELGYQDKDIDSMLKSAALNSFSEETLGKRIKENYEFLLMLGYSSREIVKMTRSNPVIYARTKKNLNAKIEDMIKLGYQKKEVVKIAKAEPSIYGYSTDTIKAKIERMIFLGYSKTTVLKMTLLFPRLYGLDIQNIKTKIDELKSLGYTQEDIINMTKVYPSLYGYTANNIGQKLDILIKSGYMKEEAIKMTKCFPGIFGYANDNLIQKIEFYNSIGLHDLIAKKAKALMQSIELSKARYSFYKEISVDIDDTKMHKLFMGQKQFQKIYNYSSNELIDKYIKNVNNGKKLIKVGDLNG